jgi:hypothetical protein
MTDYIDEAIEPIKEQETPEPEGVVKDALRAAEILKHENDRRSELLRREEALYTQKLLGGTTHGGEVPEKKAEETNVEYAKKIMAGNLE